MAASRDLHHATSAPTPTRQGAADPQGRGVHRDRRDRQPRAARRDDRARRMAAARCRRSSSARPMSAAATTHALERAGKLDAAAGGLSEGQCRMNGSSTFRVGLIQMRSGRTPAANLDAAVQADRRGEGGGADYVQTPEMTNIMESSASSCSPRSSRRRAIATLAAFRELARALGIYRPCRLARRSRSRRERAANRSFLIDPQGRDRRALRQDPHVRRRSRRRRELSRVAQLSAGRARGASPTCRGAGSA